MFYQVRVQPSRRQHRKGDQKNTVAAVTRDVTLYSYNPEMRCELKRMCSIEVVFTAIRLIVKNTSYLDTGIKYESNRIERP